MAMSNAELEVALKAALQRLVTALANKVAPDSLLLEGKSLAEITSLILAGKAATAGTADNALAVGGKSLSTIESERNAQLVAAIDALRTELETDIGNVTAESIGLGNVVNYGVATEPEALAGAVDKYVTAQLAVKIAQVKIDEIVNAAPETLNTLSEIAAALNNDPDVINTLMSSIGTNATAIEALETATAAFETKILAYFDVDGNANNANLFAGKTLNEVLDMARDGVDMSNVVLKTDDFGPYTVALDSDTSTQEVSILVETADTYTAMAHIVRVGEVVTVEVDDGNVGEDGAPNFVAVTEAEMGPDWAMFQEAIDARVGDFDQYFTLGWTNREVTTAPRTLKMHFEALEQADNIALQRISGVEQGAQQALANWTEAVQLNLNRIDTFAGETRQMAFDNQQALIGKVGVGSNVDTNVVTDGEAEVALSQVIADIKAEIATKGSASEESLALLQQKVDDFIAAKATGAEAIAGTDDAKYITALALKAALDALDLSGKLDVDAQAADSAKLGGLSLEEVIAQITNGSGAELAIKIDITEGYAPGSNITLDRVFFYDAVGDEIEHLVDLSGIQVVGGYVNYINGKVELSDLNGQSSVVFTGFGEVPKEVTHVNLEFTNLYDAKGTLSVVNAADASEVFGTYAFDAAGAQLVRNPWADGFDFPFTMPSAGGLSLAALQAAIAELESRAVLDGEHVSTNLVTFDHQDLVLEKQIQDFDTELLTREVGQELWSVVRNAGVDTFSMSTDGVTFNPLPPLEMFPEAQRPVYEALFTELSAWVDDEAAADGTVFYAVTEDRTVLGPVSKVDVLLKDVLSVLETKVAQLFKDVSRNHQNSMASDNQIREDLGNLQGEVYDLNRGVVETLAGAPEMAVKFDFSAAWTQGALHQIEALEFLGGDDSVIGTVALDQVKLHSGIMGYENGVINLSGLGYLQPRQTVLNIGDIPAGAVKLRVVGTGLENGVGVLEVGSIGAKGVVYGSLAIVENLDVANSLIVPFAVPKLSDINVLKDQAADVAGRVTDLETGKLDATAQAVDSAKLEGKSIADLTASSADGVAGVATDKFMTPAASKDAFDARWAEKVGAAPETLDTIEEIAAALRNNPDSLAAVETVAKQYTDTEVLAAIAQISGENMEAGTTLASLYAQVVALQDTKLDKTATAVNSDKLGGKSLMEVIDSAIQPGRLFYPVVHVNGSLEEDNYVMPTPADVWAQVKTNAVMEQVDTIYALGVKRLLPGNLLALTNQEGMTLRGAVSEAQEGPGYVIMRAGIEDTEWTVITDPLLGCVARLSKHCVVVGDNTERFVPGQTLFYNGFEALSENVYYDWTLMADKEWEVTTFTGTDLVIDSARYHRSEIRIQSTGPVTVTFDVPTDLPYEMEVRFVNQTGVEVTFAGSNVVSVPRMQQYTLTKVNGVVRAVRYTNTSVALAGDMDEAFFVNPDYSAPQP